MSAQEKHLFLLVEGANAPARSSTPAFTADPLQTAPNVDSIHSEKMCAPTLVIAAACDEEEDVEKELQVTRWRGSTVRGSAGVEGWRM